MAKKQQPAKETESKEKTQEKTPEQLVFEKKMQDMQAQAQILKIHNNLAEEKVINMEYIIKQANLYEKYNRALKQLQKYESEDKK